MITVSVSGIITILNTETQATPIIEKNMVIKNCAPFTNCISEINNTQMDNAKDIDAVIPMYNLIEYSNNYFPANNNNSPSFKFKTKIAGRTGSHGTKDVKIMLPLKYLSNFW